MQLANALDVDAAEDWLPQQPSLKTLEQNLRCLICYEFFTAPVMLTVCGHTFCSECVRDALETSKPACPKCGKAATESHIRSVPVLEDLVKDWQACRAGLLALVKQPARPATPPVSIGMKRKASSDIGPKSKAKGRALDYDSSLEIAGDQPCPMCEKMLPTVEISAHIERGCRDTNVASWNKMFGAGPSKTKPPSRIDKALAKENFSSIKQAKEWLKEHDLPVEGTKELLYKRAEDWIMLVNANLNRTDASSRLGIPDLRRKLLEREKQRTKSKPEVESNHQAQYKDSFKDLTAQIRARGVVKVEAAQSPVIDLDGSEEDESGDFDGLSRPSAEPVTPATDTDQADEVEMPPDLDMDLSGIAEDDDAVELIEPLSELPAYKKPRPPVRALSPPTGMPPPMSQRPRIAIA